MRYLYRVEDDEAFAYERSRRDFYLVSDDTLWAHESHVWLLSAASSASLARRIGTTYYDAVSGAPLYYERDELGPPPARTPLASVAPRGGRP
jgi:hypothetical protein